MTSAYELPKMSIADPPQNDQRKGHYAGTGAVSDLSQTRQNSYDFGEDEFNRLGYQLIRYRQAEQEAIEIFKLNVELYPKAFNTYDSLGEAYMVAGNKELAITNYKKSLELNPQNTNALRC